MAIGRAGARHVLLHGDFGEDLNLNLMVTTGSGSTLVSVPEATSTSAAQGSVLYFGLTSTDGITSIAFQNTNSGGGFPILAFDDMTLAVSAPASLLSLASALIAFAAVARRRTARA